MFVKKRALKYTKWSDITDVQREKIIRPHLFLKEKFDASGTFEIMKERFVVDGRDQTRSDFVDNYSPTARFNQSQIL